MLHLPRKLGGLSLINVQDKTLSLLIRTFLETSIMPNFTHNQHHVALFLWHVDGRKDISCPVQPPYYDQTFFNYVKEVKQEGLLNIKTMTSGHWYRWLLEDKMIYHMVNSVREKRPCRSDTRSPQVDWKRSSLQYIPAYFSY